MVKPAAGYQPLAYLPRKLSKQPVPWQDGKNIGRCLVRSKWLGLNGRACDVSVSEYHASEANVIRFMQEIEKHYLVIWPSSELCGKMWCKSQVGDVFIYRDGGHLSHDGSRYLGKVMNFYAMIKEDRS
jgi:hypothetical protein